MISSDAEVNDELLLKILQRGHSRLPVYEGNNKQARHCTVSAAPPGQFCKVAGHRFHQPSSMCLGLSSHMPLAPFTMQSIFGLILFKRAAVGGQWHC